MSRFFKKISSFTLAELLVVMAISVVVVGLSFSVLGLLQKNVALLQENYSGKTQLQLLEQQLALDMQSYPKAQFVSQRNKLVFSSPLDSVSYQFEEEYIVRKLDTFSIMPQEKEFYFIGKSVTDGAIDALKFTFSEKERTQTIFLYKRNDALSLNGNGD